MNNTWQLEILITIHRNKWQGCDSWKATQTSVQLNVNAWWWPLDSNSHQLGVELLTTGLWSACVNDLTTTSVYNGPIVMPLMPRWGYGHLIWSYHVSSTIYWPFIYPINQYRTSSFLSLSNHKHPPPPPLMLNLTYNQSMEESAKIPINQAALPQGREDEESAIYCMMTDWLNGWLIDWLINPGNTSWQPGNSIHGSICIKWALWKMEASWEYTMASFCMVDEGFGYMKTVVNT